MQRHRDSHLDHNLTADQIEHLISRFADRSGFFIETVELPAHLGTAPCALRGPLVGDPPIPDAICYRARRGDRPGDSRMTSKLGSKPTRLVTVIAGPHDDQPCVLYTAYAGPQAPREPFDPGLDDAGRAESEAFWAQHALAGEGSP
jgi:hypothetical protein